MIRRIFLPVISLSILLTASQKCPDHYNPQWFEEASDELVLIIDEYFTDKNISFPPKLKDIEDLGLLQTATGSIWELPQSTVAFKELRFPVKSGIWRYEEMAKGITSAHILIKEHTKYSEIDAINAYNGLLGSYWNDYKVNGYEMTLEPEDTRVRYMDSYFELNVKIYGLKNDATNLPKTHTDIIFRDYTDRVKAFIQCKEQQ